MFNEALDTGPSITVYVVERTPGNCPRLTEIMPSLRAYALIPRTSKPIRFVVSTAATDCGALKTIN